MNNITETLLNPPVAITAGGGVIAIQTLVTALPIIINVIMVIYLLVLVAHKIWTFRNELKNSKPKV